MAREQREVFDEVARTYDRARPPYPEAVFEDVLRFAALEVADRMLEIGAGTGKATVGFAGRGHPILCIEPGAKLAEVLRENCAGDPDVRVANLTFEDWPLEPAAFGLVFAAQSFHWVDPETGLARCAEALRPGGTLALFGNRPKRGDTELHRAVEASYATCGQGLRSDVLRKYQQRSYAEEIAANGGFGPVHQVSHAFHRLYDADGYAALLQTQSDHRLLAPDALAELLEAVRERIRAHGDAIRVDFSTDLFLARRQ